MLKQHQAHPSHSTSDKPGTLCFPPPNAATSTDHQPAASPEEHNRKHPNTGHSKKPAKWWWDDHTERLSWPQLVPIYKYNIVSIIHVYYMCLDTTVYTLCKCVNINIYIYKYLVYIMYPRLWKVKICVAWCVVSYIWNFVYIIYDHKFNLK